MEFEYCLTIIGEFIISSTGLGNPTPTEDGSARYSAETDIDVRNVVQIRILLLITTRNSKKF